MYFLNYFHTCVNVSKLIYKRIGIVVTKSSNLNFYYREAISTMRVVMPPKNSYKVSFEDENMGYFIQSSGVFEEIFYDIKSTSPSERKHLTDLTHQSMTLLKELDYRLWFIVDLLVTDIVFLKSERVGGGSGSHLFGVICISPSDTWTASDLLESILHEAIHLNLFVCDMVNSLFEIPANQLSNDNAKVVSAVRVGQLRPLDKALHSAVVAVPLMYIQHLQFKTELVDMFTDSLKVCAFGLLDKKDFYTAYGNSVVQQLANFAENQDFRKLSAEIGNPNLAKF